MGGIVLNILFYMKQSFLNETGMSGNRHESWAKPGSVVSDRFKGFFLNFFGLDSRAGKAEGVRKAEGVSP